jgi:hypothetical protein
MYANIYCPIIITNMNREDFFVYDEEGRHTQPGIGLCHENGVWHLTLVSDANSGLGNTRALREITEEEALRLLRHPHNAGVGLTVHSISDGRDEMRVAAVTLHTPIGDVDVELEEHYGYL